MSIMDCSIGSGDGLWTSEQDHFLSKDNECQLFKLLQHQLIADRMESNELKNAKCDQTFEIKARMASMLLGFVNEIICNTENNQLG